MKKEKIVAYKGFDKNLKCRDKQYKVGEEFEQSGEIKCCHNGMHACKNPLDVFGYYSPCKENRFCEVEASGDIDREGANDSKFACSKLKIKAEFSLKGFIDAAIDFVWKHAKNEGIINEYKDRSVASNSGDRSVASNSGYYSVASNSGYYSVASNSGDRSVASNSGYCSVASNSGYCSVASNSGDRSVASNSGNCSVASNSGDRSVASNSGNSSVASNSGYRSVASNSGYCSVASVDGKGSIAFTSGRFSKAKGKLGCWLVLTERDDDWNIICVKAIKVDGKKIKENTLYTLENKKIIKAKE